MSVKERILAVFFPPRCPLCGKLLPYGEEFCPACQKRLEESYAPVFRRIGLPPGIACAAPFCYEGEIRERMIELKSRENRVNARLLAPFAARLVRENVPFWKGLSVACVPGFEPKERVYNAARVLARHTARELGLPFLPDALMQCREKRRQHELGAAERQKNVQGLFLPGSAPVEGKRILLIDDIVTTGATLFSCEHTLAAAGAEEVICLAAASSPQKKERVSR
ncbi:MAG: ComF family protein [Provencibacterium sp.]|nr:ComF family protein [Provencibacterium sp.]